MSIAVVFQQNHRLITDFSESFALKDAEAALECARAIDQPKGSAIYVSVDHDFISADDLSTIERYFRIFADKVRTGSTGYRLGVYGSGKVSSRLKAAELVDLVWLARALGWSGSSDYLENGLWNLYQDAVSLKIDGLDCDSNITRPGNPDFGQFTLPSGSTVVPKRQPEDTDGSRTLFQVSSHGSLNLRGGPSLDFPIIRPLAPETRLYGLRRSGDWIQVDVEGDGRPDGYVRADYLALVAGDRDLLPVAGQQAIEVAYRELALQVREVPGGSTNPRIALYYQTLASGQPTPEDGEVPWCSYFMNFCFADIGQKGSGRANARSWLTWGRPVQGAPERGDVVILWRGSVDGTEGHVGFFVGYDGDRWLLLGGNQDNAVSIKAYDPARVLGVRRL